MTENDQQPKLNIDELAERTGIPTRTIRYYITTRLISGPTSRGKQAHYSQDHVLRLRLIRKLTARHMPLEEIATQLEVLTTAEVEALLAEEDEHAVVREEAGRKMSPRAYIESLLRRSAPAAPPAPTVVYPVQFVSSPAQVAGNLAPGSLPDRAARYPAPAAPAPPVAGSGAPGSGWPPRAAMPAPIAKEAAWKRWELAPGLELHVEVGREDGYRELVEALLRLAATEEGSPGIEHTVPVTPERKQT